MNFEWDLWLIIGYALAVIAIPHLLLLRKTPAATLAWLWAILLFPYLGVLLYWMIGTERIQRKRLKKKADYLSRHALLKIEKEEEHSCAELDDEERDWMRMLSRLQQISLSSSTSSRLLINASHFYPRLKQAIREAQTSIHIQFFIWRDDDVGREFRQLLCDAAARGVKVRVLVDEVGSLELRASHFEPLVAAGGEFSWFSTLSVWRNRFFFNLRNHRKLQIIDGRTAFVGGMNVGKEYEGRDRTFGEWEDLQIELAGPIVARLEEQFAEHWYYATDQNITSHQKRLPIDSTAAQHPCQVIERGPDSPHEVIECALVSLFHYAHRRIWICAGYFVPNSVLLIAIKMAACRGVDVRLLIPAKNDHPYLVTAGRSFYSELLAVGVRIYEYTQSMNHTKAALIDDDWLFVGSTNVDVRSMRLNFELNILLKERERAEELEKLFIQYLASATEITRKAYEQRPWHSQLLEAACRPLAPLL